MRKILTIIGARPQFIKAAPVSRAIAATRGLEEIIVHTGQHFDHNMSQVFFEQMHIPKPAHQLNIHSLPHGAMTGRMMEAIEAVILKEKPHWLMVYGDTNSTLAGALAASKLHVPVAHVEAGLRSFNMHMPEEINRIVTDRISRLLFCPTHNARKQLVDEGFDRFPGHVVVSGDVMLDAVHLFQQAAIPPAGFSVPAQYVLASVHRQENTDVPHRMEALIGAFNKVAETLPVVFPMHPRTRKMIQDKSLPPFSNNVMITNPVGYLEMVYLFKGSTMVLTDSGGMQKEAYFFEKPCITLRDETEWTELVDAGYNTICGSNPKQIMETFDFYMNNRPVFKPGLYGKGNASAIIAEALLKI